MTQFYTYLWLRDDGTPYYVGKGCGRRAYQRDSHRLPPPEKSRIVVFPAGSEAEAFAQEIVMIDLFGRKDAGTGCLRNLTDGGENPPSGAGIPKSARFKQLLSERSQGNTWGSKSRGFSGKTHTAEAKEKQRRGSLGRTQTPEAIAKTRAAIIGKPKSAEHRAKLSAALTGKCPSDATKAKMNASRKKYLDREFLKTVAWG